MANIVAKELFLQHLKRLVLSVIALVVACQLLVSGAIAAEVADIPDLDPGDRTWVADLAGVLSSTTESAVYGKLEKLAKDTGNQVRFLTVQRIDFGQPTSEFAGQLFDKWFKTPAERANQTLVLIATEDYRTAIATGEKVKSLVPDKIADSIAAETVLFPVQKANFNQAVLDGASRLTAVLSGKPDPGPPAIVVLPETDASNFKTAEETDVKSSTFLVIGLLLIATVIPMVTYFWFQNQS